MKGKKRLLKWGKTVLEKIKTNWKFVIALAVFLIGCFVSLLFNRNFSEAGALISALASVGAIYTVCLQRKELQIQREELRGQREEAEKQNKTLLLQRFENTFFGMMRTQQEIVSGLSWNPGNGQVVQGRELFGYTFERATVTVYTLEKPPYSTLVPPMGMDLFLSECGFSYYESTNIPQLFDHYFRHLYTMVKFVDETKFLSYDEKYNYMRMIRATLSRYELVWLFYNGLSPYANEKFKPLIERYSLLKNLRRTLLALSKENLTQIRGDNSILKEMAKNKFPETDFVFWITDEKNDEKKYHISAFYNEKDIHKGEELLSRWRKFCEEHSIHS